VTPIAPLLAARQFIDKISKPTTILAAVSGGSDSTGLLIALHRAVRDAGRSDIQLHAVTIDHALRSESAMEAQGVALLCERIGIPSADMVRNADGMQTSRRAVFPQRLGLPATG